MELKLGMWLSVSGGSSPCPSLLNAERVWALTASSIASHTAPMAPENSLLLFGALNSASEHKATM